jgi:hypothetical protein
MSFLSVGGVLSRVISDIYAVRTNCHLALSGVRRKSFASLFSRNSKSWMFPPSACCMIATHVWGRLGPKVLLGCTTPS